MEKHELSGVQLAEEANQVLQAAAEEIDAPRHHHVELAPGGCLAERIEGRTLCPCPWRR